MAHHNRGKYFLREELRKIIVVEGPDGSGKTTLIRRMSLELGWPIAPRVVSKDAEAMVDLKVWVEENLAKGFQRMIYDRHRLISEPIYGSILRNEAEPGFNDLDWLIAQYHLFYNICRPLIIYCLPPQQVVFNNIVHDPDNVVVRHQIDKIYRLYAAHAARDYVQGSVLVYDYTDPYQEQRIVDHISDLIRWRRV